MKRTVLTAIALFFATSIAYADTYEVSHFATEGLSGWEVKSFKGMTEYKIVTENGKKIIKAHSNRAASGLFKKVKLDPKRFRRLRWSWKISDTIANGNESSKEGDDYAARVYVVFPGRFFWQTKAINYIWANRLPKGEFVPNAYTGNAMMLAVESGPDKRGIWITEERDILADYRRLFGEEPRETGAVAIMSDTDNTGSDATAWYGEITFVSGQ